MPDETCLSCVDFIVIPGEKDCSEDTLGWDVEIHCRKKRWEINLFSDTEDDYEQKMMSAKDCEDYARR